MILLFIDLSTFYIGNPSWKIIQAPTIAMAAVTKLNTSSMLTVSRTFSRLRSILHTCRHFRVVLRLFYFLNE